MNISDREFVTFEGWGNKMSYFHVLRGCLIGGRNLAHSLLKLKDETQSSREDLDANSSNQVTKQFGRTVR